MKKQNSQDERVVAQRRKIISEAYGILMIALFCSILVQKFLLNAPFEQYAVEFICIFGMSLYLMIRHLTLGLVTATASLSHVCLKSVRREQMKSSRRSWRCTPKA